MVAAFPAVLWGQLFYRKLEKQKSEALKENKGRPGGGGGGSLCQSKCTGGIRWSQADNELHINILELLAVEHVLRKSFRDEVCVKHVKVLTDNSCAVS